MADGRGMSPIRRSLALLLVLVPCASAQAATVPSQSSLTAPIRVPSMGGFSLGSETTTVTYTDTDETVTTSAPSVMLGKGTTFRVQTCVQIHLYGKVPVSQCADRAVDTTKNTATVKVAAPTVKLNAIRPSAGGSGYTTGQV